jgi:hypothetical protein
MTSNALFLSREGLYDGNSSAGSEGVERIQEMPAAWDTDFSDIFPNWNFNDMGLPRHNPSGVQLVLYYTNTEGESPKACLRLQTPAAVNAILSICSFLTITTVEVPEWPGGNEHAPPFLGERTWGLIWLWLYKRWSSNFHSMQVVSRGLPASLEALRYIPFLHSENEWMMSPLLQQMFFEDYNHDISRYEDYSCVNSGYDDEDEEHPGIYEHEFGHNIDEVNENPGWWVTDPVVAFSMDEPVDTRARRLFPSDTFDSESYFFLGRLLLAPEYTISDVWWDFEEELREFIYRDRRRIQEDNAREREEEALEEALRARVIEMLQEREREIHAEEREQARTERRRPVSLSWD